MRRCISQLCLPDLVPTPPSPHPSHRRRNHNAFSLQLLRAHPSNVLCHLGACLYALYPINCPADAPSPPLAEPPTSPSAALSASGLLPPEPIFSPTGSRPAPPPHTRYLSLPSQCPLIPLLSDSPRRPLYPRAPIFVSPPHLHSSASLPAAPARPRADYSMMTSRASLADDGPCTVGLPLRSGDGADIPPLRCSRAAVIMGCL